MAYQSVFKPGLFAGLTVIVTGGGFGIGRCKPTSWRTSARSSCWPAAGRKVSVRAPADSF